METYEKMANVAENFQRLLQGWLQTLYSRFLVVAVLHIAFLLLCFLVYSTLVFHLVKSLGLINFVCLKCRKLPSSFLIVFPHFSIVDTFRSILLAFGKRSGFVSTSLLKPTYFSLFTCLCANLDNIARNMQSFGNFLRAISLGLPGLPRLLAIFKSVGITTGHSVGKVSCLGN